MRIDTIRNVKTALNRVVRELPATGSVIITRDGRPCAVLMLITEDSDLEAIALSQNRAFWAQLDQAQRQAEKRGWTRIEDVPQGRTRRRAPRRRAL
jgi:antitoxin (DNA-binding transcriptional repressor) of toxin-antitoxin stability system